MTIKDKVWRGVCELLVAHNTRDDKRFAAGQEIIRQALAEISAGRESGQLAELNSAADEMMEIAHRWIEDRDEQLAFMRCRERHQAGLAKLAEGGNKDEMLKNNAKMRGCLQYAIGRLTDNDLSGAPDDLRHEWVKQAANVLAEGTPMTRNETIT